MIKKFERVYLFIYLINSSRFVVLVLSFSTFSDFIPKFQRSNKVRCTRGQT